MIPLTTPEFPEFPTGSSRYNCTHQKLGSGELLISNELVKEKGHGISARFFPAKMEQVWYLNRDKGSTTEDVMRWLTDNDMDQQISVINGQFHIKDYCQLVVLNAPCKMVTDNKFGMYQFDLKLHWPVYNKTFTRPIVCPNKMYRSALSGFYPGMNNHTGMGKYYEWVEGERKNQVDKARDALAAARSQRI